MTPISGHPELYVAQEMGSSGVNANLWQITVYENGEPIAVIDETLEGFDNMWINGADPTGQFLVLSHYSSTSPVSAFELVDLRNCDGLKCERVSLAGWPLWSPDGRFTFITSMQANLSAINQEPELLLGDERGQNVTSLGVGYSPFWLDSERFMFIRMEDEGTELVTAVIGQETVTPLLTTHDLLAQIPLEIDETAVSLDLGSLLQPSEAQDKIALVLSENTGDLVNKRRYFIADLGADGASVENIEFVYELEGDGWLVPSPDMRWLTEIKFTSTDPETDIVLHHVETGATKVFAGVGFSYAWSSDGNWFAYNDGNVLVVVAPGTEFTHLAMHPFADCWQMEWVEP
ncbi:MAG: hypothetical protein GY943_11965 [Chloroflexi bacterium]|nr:hypothetical protein [Chloroflexota bacterium]